jgi:4-hydroxy-tetrahydrodipicolinate reductase
MGRQAIQRDWSITRSLSSWALKMMSPASSTLWQHVSAEQLIAEHPVDMIVDFSSPEGINYYASVAKSQGIRVVSAISQYSSEQVDVIDEIARHTAILWSPNITIGINYLMLAARVLKQIVPDIDIEIVEEHFKAKPEVSGTAKILASALDIDGSDIKSIRAGGIVGRHEVLFGFPYQTVRLTHESISREAFGNGAHFACMQLRDRPPGRYTLDGLLAPYFALDGLPQLT